MFTGHKLLGRSTLQAQPSKNSVTVTWDEDDQLWRGRFHSMYSPCEMLIDGGDQEGAKQIVQMAVNEARRVDRKFSRYRNDNIVHKINSANGEAVEVDSETASLINSAVQSYELSEGRFDITIGVLRQAWQFDAEAEPPEQYQIDRLKEKIGWHRVEWDGRTLTLPAGMEIDFGGIGKEYAVDRVAQLLSQEHIPPVLIDFGSDIFATGARKEGSSWRVAIDAHQDGDELGMVEIRRGGIASSGLAPRHLMNSGRHHCHILDPHSGWPVEHAPHSVTVVAESCMEAGRLATLAVLNGSSAVKFLDSQQAHYQLIDGPNGTVHSSISSIRSTSAI